MEFPIVDMSDENLIVQIESLKKQKVAIEQMLAYVLKAIGHPVIVPKSIVENGIPEGSKIAVLQNTDDEYFVFKLENNDDGKS